MKKIILLFLIGLFVGCNNLSVDKVDSNLPSTMVFVQGQLISNVVFTKGYKFPDDHSDEG